MHVIVTGGSSGIGLAVAQQFAARGAKVSLIARDEARLAAARSDMLRRHPQAAVETFVADIAEDEALRRAIASAQDRLGACDILVASAGVVEPGRFDAMPAASFDRQIATNLTGTANSIRAVIGGMQNRGRGKVMVISSGAGLIGLYGYAGYCASKAALSGLVEALRAEYSGCGLVISLAFPPDTQTPQLAKELEARAPEADLLMGKIKPRKADEIAAAIVKALDRGSRTVYFTPGIAGLALFSPLVKPVLFGWFHLRLRQLRRQAGRNGS